MIRRALLIGFSLVGVWFLWAVLPDVARSWKTREPGPSELGSGREEGLPIS